MNTTLQNIVEQKIQAINNRIASWNDGLNPSKFSINDYVELELYKERHTKFTPPSFLSFASYLQLLSLSESSVYKPLWYFKDKDFNDRYFLNTSLSFLTTIIYDFNVLFEQGKIRSALILFRSYIESSTSLFLSTIDFQFYKSTLQDSKNMKAEIDLWIKTLSPSKVKSALKEHHKIYNEQFKQGGTIKIDQRTFIENTFLNDETNELYSNLSKIAHGNVNFLNLLREDQKQLTQIHVSCVNFLVLSVQVISCSLNHYLKNNSSYDFRRSIINIELWNEFYAI